VRWLIHAVGSIHGIRGKTDLLRSAYTSSLARADEVGARAVAFRSISTGVYGYPGAEAAALSVEAITSAATHVERVLLVAFTSAMTDRWKRRLHGG